MSLRHHEALYPILVLIALAGSSLWLQRITYSPFNAAHSQNRQPDSIAEDVRFVSFDATGQQVYALTARRLSHFPAQALSRVDHPVITQSLPSQQLTVRARSGIVEQNGNSVTLHDRVRIEHHDANKPPLYIDAQQLTLWPHQKRAESLQPITLRQGGIWAAGNHLVASKLFGNLSLGGGTTVTFEPSKP